MNVQRGSIAHEDVHAAAAAGLGEARVAQLVEQRPDDVDGDARGVREAGARLGVQVDPQLVGVLDVRAGRVPGVERDGAEVARPRRRPRGW